MAPKAGLDTERVIHAAADLADANGGEVSMGALAAHLGVRTPSLYNHIAGQDALRRQLALRGLRDLAARLHRAAAGLTDDAALLAFADAYRRFASEHPGLYALSLRAPDPDDAEMDAVSDEILAVLLAVMRSYDLAGDDAIHAIRGLRSLLHGFVALEAQGGFGIPLELDASYQHALQTFIHGLRAQQASASD